MDEEDVDEMVPASCKLQVTVQLSVPVYPTEGRAKVYNVLLSLQKPAFQFDVTWFTSHFHNLDDLWANQELLIQDKIKAVLNDSFTVAIQFNRPSNWLERKYLDIDNEIINATKEKHAKAENT